MVALLARVGLVVLVAHLQVFQSERLRMPVLGTHGTIFRCDGAIGILDGVQALVNPRLNAVVGRHTTVPQAHVHHIERLSTQVLGQLQIFVIAQSVGGAIAPVHVPVPLALLYRTDGALPAESVVGTLLAFHEAATGEAHELRVHLPQHIGEVGTHTVRTVLKCRWEEAHHVYLYLPYTIEDQRKLCLRVVAVGYECCLVFRPAFGFCGRESTNHCLGIEL